jgi:hypothetical protein
VPAGEIALILGSLMPFAVMAAVTRKADWYRGGVGIAEISQVHPNVGRGCFILAKQAQLSW